MAFHWICAKGHAQGVWKDAELSMAVEAGSDPFIAKCHCGRKRKLEQYRDPGSVNAIPDIPSHFNSAFGHEVRGRRHLKALQRQHGVEDFEPDSHARERLREGQRRSELSGNR